jgi:hypothetical protein
VFDDKMAETFVKISTTPTTMVKPGSTTTPDVSTSSDGSAKIVPVNTNGFKRILSAATQSPDGTTTPAKVLVIQPIATDLGMCQILRPGCSYSQDPTSFVYKKSPTVN